MGSVQLHLFLLYNIPYFNGKKDMANRAYSRPSAFATTKIGISPQLICIASYMQEVMDGYRRLCIHVDKASDIHQKRSIIIDAPCLLF